MLPLSDPSERRAISAARWKRDERLGEVVDAIRGISYLTKSVADNQISSRSQVLLRMLS